MSKSHQKVKSCSSVLPKAIVHLRTTKCFSIKSYFFSFPLKDYIEPLKYRAQIDYIIQTPSQRALPNPQRQKPADKKQSLESKQHT